jgi:hypothetical protein
MQIDELRRPMREGSGWGAAEFSRHLGARADLAGRDSLNIAAAGHGVALACSGVTAGAGGRFGGEILGAGEADHRCGAHIGAAVNYFAAGWSSIFTAIATNEPLAEGRAWADDVNLTMKEVNKAPGRGDWVVMNDRDVAATVNGQRLGQIVIIQKLPKAPLTAEILLKPLVNFDTLREVMVVTGQPAPAPQQKPIVEQRKPVAKPAAQPARTEKTKSNVRTGG